MERNHYYAYNKTREAFLSLGVSVADQVGGSFRPVLSQRQLKTNEGIWLFHAEIREDLLCNSPCDQVYLDAALCVVALNEGLPTLPLGSGVPLFESVLLLPVHTIFGSQTQAGDQILIGTIEEIGAILNGIEPILNASNSEGNRGDRLTMEAPMRWLSRILSARDRRRDARQLSPPLMAFYWDGGIPVPHPVPDISRTGLFLQTADRWHPRTLLRVTLQRKADDAVTPDDTITVQCRVVRTGGDGVGMAFMLAEGTRDGKAESSGRLASKKDLNRFLRDLVSDFNGEEEVEHPYLPFPELSSAPSEPQGEADAAEPKGLDRAPERESQAS